MKNLTILFKTSAVPWLIWGLVHILAAITGGLADLGYFLFMDLGGHVHFMPGTLITIVSSLAIITSFYAYFKADKLKTLYGK